jgi:hypothetical protein
MLKEVRLGKVRLDVIRNTILNNLTVTLYLESSKATFKTDPTYTEKVC